MSDHDETEASSSSAKKPILISTAATLLDLKADLLKRTKNLKKTDYSDNYVNRTKNNLLIVTKEEKKTQNEVKSARHARIAHNEALLKKEEEAYLKQRQILEQKAAAYEKLSRGEKMVREDGTAAEFLVNFQEKVKEVEAVNEEKRKKELRPVENEPEVVEFRPDPLIVHYDHNEDKGRVFGPSHIKLSHLNEEEREKQIRELKEMTEKTKETRLKRKKQKTEEEKAIQTRLNAIRKRKGLPPIESDDEEDKNEEETSIGPAIPKELQDIPLPEGEPDDISSPAKKPKPTVREWDRGKTGFGYQTWVTKEREKRDDDFRPPTFYYE